MKVLLLLLFAALPLSFAQASSFTGQVNLQQFRWSSSTTFATLEDTLLRKSHSDNNWKYILGANYSFVSSPLTVETRDNGKTVKVLVDKLSTLNLMGGYRFTKKFMFTLQTSYNQSKVLTPQDTQSTEYKTESAFEDIMLRVKWALYESKSKMARWSLNPYILIPAGGEKAFVSDGAPAFAVDLAYEKAMKYFQFLFNIGYKYSKDAEYINSSFNGLQVIDYRHKILTAFGAFIPINRRWGVNAEWQRNWTLPFNSEQNPNELYAGLRYSASKSLKAWAGVSLGNIGDEQSNNHRLGLGFKWAPRASKKKKKVMVEKEEPKKVVHRGKIVRFRVKVYFKTGSTEVFPSEQEKLDRLISFYERNKSSIKKISMEGHASKLGSPAINEALSIKRAQSCHEYLELRDIPKQLMDFKFYGEGKQAVKTNSESSNLQENRRVEFIIYQEE